MARSNHVSGDPSEDDSGAPVLGTWRRWYALVLGTLALTILGFTLLSRFFR